MSESFHATRWSPARGIALLSVCLHCAPSAPHAPPTSPSPVEVALGPLDARGALRADELAPVLTRALPALSACYIAALRLTPGRRGFVVVTLVVAPDGSVPSLGFDNSIRFAGDAVLEKCLISGLRGEPFPARPAPTDLSVVVTFSLTR